MKCSITSSHMLMMSLTFVTDLKNEQISFLEKSRYTAEEELLRIGKENIEFDKRVPKLETIPGIRSEIDNQT